MTKLTKLQKRIITVAGVVTVGMLLYPPWEINRGYGFVFDPPNNRGISWGVLGLQLVACWGIAGLVWFIWGTSDKSE